jgi:hypothetical protein
MAFFKLRPKSDIEQISARIEAAETALATAEQVLTATAASAALADDPLKATAKERAAVDEANARLRILQDGLAHAERADASARTRRKSRLGKRRSDPCGRRSASSRRPARSSR